MTAICIGKDPKLCVGKLPQRKSKVLYWVDGSVYTPLAYFRDDECADIAAEFIYGLIGHRIVGEEFFGDEVGCEE